MSESERAHRWNRKVTLLVIYYRIFKNVEADGDYRDHFLYVLAQGLEHSRYPQKVMGSMNE